MTPPAAEAGPRGPRRPRSVLLAEHEPDVAEMSARYLRRDGLLVCLVTTPEQALAQLTTELTGGQDAAAGGLGKSDAAAAGLGKSDAAAAGLGRSDAASGLDLTVLDLTVLDLTMPGLDPRRLRRALRTPVIFLAAGPQGPGPRGLVRGPAGPRRWLTRPFGPRQLVAMARDVLAEAPRAPGGADEARTDEARTDQAAERVGGTLRLTPAESAILAALLAQPGRVLSRRQLLAAAGRQTAGDRAADVYIAQLRAKLGASGEVTGPGAIRTVRGAGYVADP